MTKKKPTKPAKAVKPLKEKTLPDGAIMDFSELGLDDLKLTPKEAQYVFWYTNPDYDTFQNKTRSAVKAGYKQDSARYIAYHLHGKKNVVEAIRRLSELLLIDVKEEFHKIIRLRWIARIHYDVADYYKRDTIILKNPITKEYEEIEVETLKDSSELTPEQRLAVDGVDYKGVQGRKVYIFADREKSMNEMMSLYKKFYGEKPEDENEDGEATMEIIKPESVQKVS